MKFKRILSVAAAFTVAAAAAMTMMISTVSAAEKELAYTGPSDKAYALENDGVSLRLNIFNKWSSGQETADINDKGEFAEKISVTFTVDGLGTNSANIADDGTKTPYKAFLSGSVGVDTYWGPTANNNTVDNESVAINGDGTYTVDFLLSTPADTILCLILSTNINAYSYTSTGKPADTGITFTIDKITTVALAAVETDTSATDFTDPATEAVDEPTESATGGVAVAPTDATEVSTAAVADTSVTTAVQTTAAAAVSNSNNSAGSTSGNQVSNNTSNAPTTKDAGIAAAFAGLVATAAVGVLTQLRRK